MNKRILKYLIILIIILLIVLGLIYLIDLDDNDNKSNNTSLLNKNTNTNTNINDNNENKSFFGRVMESSLKYIIVEPNEEEQIRKSTDKISIGLGENNDALYKVGTNIKVTYTGPVMESYPAQVKVIDIEIKSVDDFEIQFFYEQSKSDSKICTILDKSETDKYNYNIYAYEGNVNIVINGKTLSLRDALLENKITMDEIIVEANKDFPNAPSYDDGGSIEYHYDNYTIIKCHKLDGNRDVYIGPKDMTLNNINV